MCALGDYIPHNCRLSANSTQRYSGECICEIGTIKLQFVEGNDQLTSDVINCFGGKFYIFGHANNNYIILDKDAGGLLKATREVEVLKN